RGRGQRDALKRIRRTLGGPHLEAHLRRVAAGAWTLELETATGSAPRLTPAEARSEPGAEQESATFTRRRAVDRQCVDGEWFPGGSRRIEQRREQLPPGGGEQPGERDRLRPWPDRFDEARNVAQRP